MVGSQANICTIVIDENVEIKNTTNSLDVELQLIDSEIAGHIKASKSDTKSIIDISNLSNKNFKLKLDIFLNEGAFLELRDESEYKYGTCISIKSRMEKDSIFEYFRLNNFLKSSKNDFIHDIEISSNCEFRDFNFSNGSDEMNNKTTVHLNDENASYIGSGVMISNSTNSNNNLLINHLSKSAKSDCSFKTVSRGSSNVSFSGKVFVDHHCSKTISNQISKGLIMDETAKISLTPKLEINNDDVICAHGAASGKPDETIIFYLKSRGISHEQAEKIYIEGFLGEFLEKISNNEMQRKAMNYISANC